MTPLDIYKLIIEDQQSLESVTSIKNLFKKAGLVFLKEETTIKEKEIATTLYKLNSYKTSQKTNKRKFKLENFAIALNELQPSTKWNIVLKSFDQENFIFEDKKLIQSLIIIFKNLFNEEEKYPFDLLWEEWIFLDAQYSFLYQIISISPPLIDLIQYSKRRVFKKKYIDTYNDQQCQRICKK